MSAVDFKYETLLGENLRFYWPLPNEQFNAGTMESLGGESVDADAQVHVPVFPALFRIVEAQAPAKEIEFPAIVIVQPKTR